MCWLCLVPRAVRTVVWVDFEQWLSAVAQLEVWGEVSRACARLAMSPPLGRHGSRAQRGRWREPGWRRPRGHRVAPPILPAPVVAFDHPGRVARRGKAHAPGGASGGAAVELAGRAPPQPRAFPAPSTWCTSAPAVAPARARPSPPRRGGLAAAAGRCTRRGPHPHPLAGVTPRVLSRARALHARALCGAPAPTAHVGGVPAPSTLCGSARPGSGQGTFGRGVVCVP